MKFKKLFSTCPVKSRSAGRALYARLFRGVIHYSLIIALLMGGTANAGFFDWFGSFFKTAGTDLHASADGLVGQWMLDEANEWYGPELLTNPGFEGSYNTTGTLTIGASWANEALDDGVDTAAQETTIVHSGTSSQKFTADISAEGVKQSMVGLLTIGKKYQASVWVYPTQSSVYFQMWDGASLHGGIFTGLTTNAWNNISLTFTADGVGGSYFRILSNVATSQTIYVDDASLKEILVDDLTSNENSGALYKESDDYTPNANTGGFVDGSFYASDRYATADSAMDFNGTSDSINIGDQDLTSSQITLSAWINSDVINTGVNMVIGKWKNDTNERSYGLVVNYVNTGSVALAISSTGTNYQVPGTAANAISQDTWHHVVATYDGTAGVSGYKIYVDGVSQSISSLASSGAEPDGIYGSSANITLGRADAWGGGPIYFNGEIHDARIYNRVLSAWEVKNSMKKPSPDPTSRLTDGLVGHWTLAETEEINGSDLVSGWDFTDGNWSVFSDGNIVNANTFDTSTSAGGIEYIGLVNTGKRYRMVLAGTTDSTFRIRAGNGTIYDAAASTIDFDFEFTAVDNTIQLYRNSASTGVVITNFELYEVQSSDVTGNGNTAVLFQDDTIFTTDHNSVSNGAMDFESSVDEYLNCGDSVSELTFGTGAHSYSAWVKPESFGDNTYRYIVSTGNNSSGEQSGFGLYDQQSELVFFHSAYSTPIITSNSVANDISTGSWYHVALTHDGTNTRFYLNGEQIGSEQAIAINTTTGKCRIGSHLADLSPFDGVIEDVKIYNRTLTDREVYQLYTEPATVRNKTLTDGLVGRWTLTDRDSITTGSDLLSGWDFTSGWSTMGNGSITDTDTYSASSGGVRINSILTAGKRYRMNISGTVGNITNGNMDVRDYDYSDTFLNGVTGTFDETFEFTATDAGITLLTNDSGGAVNTDISSMDLYEILATDVTGNENHGTINNISTTSDHNSIADSAMTFNGTSSYIPISGTNNDYSTGSASFWVKTGTTPGSSAVIIGGGLNSRSIHINTSGQIGFYDGTNAKSGSTDITDDAWHHVTVVRETSSSFKIYVDGTAETLVSDTSWASSSKFLLGARDVSSPSKFFTGSLSDVRIYDRPLSAWEVYKLYNES